MIVQHTPFESAQFLYSIAKDRSYKHVTHFFPAGTAAQMKSKANARIELSFVVFQSYHLVHL